MNIEVVPLGERVLIKPREASNTTASGLIIPDSAKEIVYAGAVVSVGPGVAALVKDGEVPLQSGDEVIYGKYSGTEIDIAGKKHRIIMYTDIYGKVKSNTTDNVEKN